MGRANGRWGGVVVLAVLAAGCSADGRAPERLLASSSPAAPEPSESGESTAADCPVTLGSPFRPPDGVRRDALFGAASSHGNGRLWVGGLFPRGVIVADFAEPDGSAHMKFGWWRQVRDRLTITGRRLDAPAPPLRAEVPPGYGMAGFQASGVFFPTEGCWEITGSAGSTTLTFVTVVRERAT